MAIFIMYWHPLIFGLLIFSSLLLSQALPLHDNVQKSYADDSLCIDFIPTNTTIRLECGSAMFSDIYNFIEKYSASIRGLEGLLEKESGNGIWLLKSNIVVGSNSTLTINSTDTRWLKIYSDGKKAYSIKVLGMMNIDSVKITSWNQEADNYYQTTKNDSSDHRAYISVMREATGTTNITNSELAYLGYNASGSFGLSYYAGADSMIKNNKIHHLWYGFYSANYRSGVYNISIENNYFFDNYLYGIDPHSGTHDLMIRNNTIYDNGKHGIICSKNCSNIIIEGNKVFGNMDRGIMLDKNITNSTIADNIIHHNLAQISIHTLSNSNKIKNNTVYGGDIGIEISDRSSNNIVSNNTISDTRYGIYMLDAGPDNKLFYNTIKYASDCSIFIEDDRSCIRDIDKRK